MSDPNVVAALNKVNDHLAEIQLLLFQIDNRLEQIERDISKDNSTEE
jgi:hypothetical protein